MLCLKPPAYLQKCVELSAQQKIRSILQLVGFPAMAVRVAKMGGFKVSIATNPYPYIQTRETGV